MEAEWEFFVLNFLFYHSRRQLFSYSFVSFQSGFLGGECGDKGTHSFFYVFRMWLWAYSNRVVFCTTEQFCHAWVLCYSLREYCLDTKHWSKWELGNQHCNLLGTWTVLLLEIISKTILAYWIQKLIIQLSNNLKKPAVLVL